MSSSTEEFLTRFSTHVDFVLGSINGDKNRQLFLQTSYDLYAAASRYDCLFLTRNFLKGYMTTVVKREKNGWFSHKRTMRTLAVMVAEDVINSVEKRRGV